MSSSISQHNSQNFYFMFYFINDFGRTILFIKFFFSIHCKNWDFIIKYTAMLNNSVEIVKIYFTYNYLFYTDYLLYFYYFFFFILHIYLRKKRNIFFFFFLPFLVGQYYAATIVVANYLPIYPRNYFGANFFPIQTRNLKCFGSRSGRGRPPYLYTHDMFSTN